MKRCPYCVSPVRDGASVCPHCQNKIGFRYDRLAGLIIVVIVLAVAFWPRSQSETVNTLIAAHKACEAQTGEHCR